MNKDGIKEILYIVIAVLLGMVAVKFVIWLLPLILIALCSYYIYKLFIKPIKKEEKKPTKKYKKKEIKIIDMEETD